MPLITGKSPKAMGQNIRVEMAAGKPQKQALAIAYAKKREAERRRKLWTGGKVGLYDEGGEVLEDTPPPPPPPTDTNPASRSLKRAFHTPGYAEGGEVYGPEDEKDLDYDKYLDTPTVPAPIAGGYSDGGIIDEAEKEEEIGSPTEELKEEPHDYEMPRNIFQSTDFSSFSDPARDSLIEEPHPITLVMALKRRKRRL